MIIDVRQSTAAGDKSMYGDSRTSMAAIRLLTRSGREFHGDWSRLDYRDHNPYLPIAGLLHFSNNRVMLQLFHRSILFGFSVHIIREGQTIVANAGTIEV